MDTKKFIAAFLLFGLAILVLYALLPFVEALLAAVVFYVLFKPLHEWFVSRGLGKNISALTVILISLLIIIIPLFFVGSVAFRELLEILKNMNYYAGLVESIDLSFFDVENIVKELGSYLKTIIVPAMQQITSVVISLVIMYFTFFFMLTEHTTLSKGFRKVVPFSKANSQKLIDDFRNISRSTIIVSGLIAVAQGVMLGVGFWILGLEDPLLWGVIATILSFIPLLGPPFIWIPASIIQFSMGNLYLGYSLLILGVLMAVFDGLFRPWLQNKVGKVHPLITLIGVFIGIPLFGIIGLILGPIMLSSLILMYKIFDQEYF